MITDLSAFYLIYLKYMKNVFTTKLKLTLMKSYLNINVDFAKDLIHTLPSKHYGKMARKCEWWRSVWRLMTDFPKAFHSLHHRLVIAKLDAHGFDIKSVKITQQYLTNRKQRVKVGNTYSSWKETFWVILQESILGPLIFNVFLCDLFCFLGGIAVSSYADDTTLYSANKTNHLIITQIEQFSEVLFSMVWL